VRKCRLGKAQIELELVLVEMLKDEGNNVIIKGDHMTEAIWMYSRRADCEEGVTKV
jgi:hypothetical protein